MSYLHSLNIVHRDLKMKNILLDSYLYPKLANFCFSTLPENFGLNEQNQGIMGNPIYSAPEVFENEEYSKSSDVYAFSLIVYEIITEKKPFNFNTIFQVMTKVLNGERPVINDTVPESYQKLIESCWSQEPSKRPTFSQIVKELRTNESFIYECEDIDKEEYQTYINYIDEYSKKNLLIEEFFKNKKLIKVDLASIKKKHSDELKTKINIKYVKLNNFKKLMKVGEGAFGCVYKLFEKKTNKIYAGKISKIEIDQFDEDLLVSHYREVEILSMLNHPCVIQFIGYSPINFEQEECPVIITEFTSGGTLSDVLKSERNSLSLEKWNNTTKLINIYGIAISMMYLHQLDIIHRDLKPDNILLDELLYPKLADFGLSKIISSKTNNIVNTNYELKGTLIYCAPEILSSFQYSKAGDVYAFGLIVYEIVTNEIPFKNITNIFQLLHEVVTEKNRPSLDLQTPQCYKNLIESCWSQNPEKRPTFEQIVENIKDDSDFLLDDADEGVFLDFIDKMDEIVSKFKMNSRNLEKSVKNDGKRYDDPKIEEKNEERPKSSSNKLKVQEASDSLNSKRIEEASSNSNNQQKAQETSVSLNKQRIEEASNDSNNQQKTQETSDSLNKQRIEEASNDSNNQQKAQETSVSLNKQRIEEASSNSNNATYQTKPGDKTDGGCCSIY